MALLKSKTIQILIVAIALVLAADVVTRAAAGTDEVSMVDNLAEPPIDNGIYLLGNSMFKTGIDVAGLQSHLANDSVQFGYFNGHYTSLWYLIAKGALGPSDLQPNLVVWGFRPRFAILPAYRQNRANSTELFEFGDPAYERITRDAIPSPAVDVIGFIGDAGLLTNRDDAQNALQGLTTESGLRALDLAGQTLGSLGDRLRNDETTVADEIVRAVTGGEIQLTEEQVVDGVGDFIVGPRLGFESGFIPLTADSLMDSQLQQLVVIWRPANMATGNSIAEEDQFVADSIQYFEQRGIPYLDLYHDDRITPEMFGKGDHYNVAGRELITTILADAIKGLLSDA